MVAQLGLDDLTDGVQVGATEGVDDTLWRSGRAGRVVDRDRLLLVEQQ